MKYCHECHRLTPGKNPYCGFCGKSFNVRLCPRQHINPRSAQACSQCGSRELSLPQAKVPLLLRPLLFLLTLTPGFVLLALLSGFVVLFVRKLFLDPNGLLPLMCIGFVLGLLLLLWMMLPQFLRRFLKKLLLPSSKDGGTKHR